MSPKLLIFDLDGVLIESLDIKTEAFRQTFQQYSDSIDEIITYHKNNPGKSRYEKIPHIFKNILHITLDPETESMILSELTRYLDTRLVEVPLVAGCIEFLEQYAHEIPCTVVSAAPESDAKKILQQKGIAHFFQMVYGSPAKKPGNILSILGHYQVNPSDAIMVGDALTDYYAAKEVGCRFIGRIQEGKENPFLNLTGIEKIIFNFYNLKTYLIHRV